MRDLLALTGLISISTNQPKSVNLYAKEATEPLFVGSMAELKLWDPSDCNISKEIWASLSIVEESKLTIGKYNFLNILGKHLLTFNSIDFISSLNFSSNFI